MIVYKNSLKYFCACEINPLHPVLFNAVWSNCGTRGTSSITLWHFRLVQSQNSTIE